MPARYYTLEQANAALPRLNELLSELMEARRANVRGAFRAVRRFDGARVLVVDDVMTSGATLTEVALALRAAGALSVENLVLARTLRD